MVLFLGYLKEHEEHIKAGRGWRAQTVTLTSILGTIYVEVCETCGYEDVRCAHTKNSWDDHGAQLTCDLCGEDVT